MAGSSSERTVACFADSSAQGIVGGCDQPSSPPSLSPLPQQNTPPSTFLRQRKKKQHGNSQDETQGDTKRDNTENSLGRLQDSLCCKCAASYTGDCAAVCCCPLALLHLMCLAIIKLPSVIAWRVMTSVKRKLCTRKPCTLDDVNNGHNDRKRTYCPNSSCVWQSPDEVNPISHVVRFDTQNLLKHFNAEQLGFGWTSLKRD